MNCDNDCCADYDPYDDDFEIQRLEEIISICEFLIKHKKNARLKEKLDDLMDKAKDELSDEEKDTSYPYTVTKYVKPIWIVPEYYPKSWWSNYPWKIT